MNQSIINELISHAEELIKDGRINQDNIDDAHHIAFGEDYYIIGYHQADEWLKKHYVSPWEAIEYVISQKNQHFGSEIEPQEINSESVANYIAYFAGFEVDFEELLGEQ